MRPGIPELIVILVIILLLFGPGRLGKIAGELGAGIRNFRKELTEGTDEESEPEETEE